MFYEHSVFVLNFMICDKNSVQRFKGIVDYTHTVRTTSILFWCLCSWTNQRVFLFYCFFSMILETSQPSPQRIEMLVCMLVEGFCSCLLQCPVMVWSVIDASFLTCLLRLHQSLAGTGPNGNCMMSTIH